MTKKLEIENLKAEQLISQVFKLWRKSPKRLAFRLTI